MYDKNITPLSYKDAGVDIDAGNTLVERIKHISKDTQRSEVLSGLGGFGALFHLPTGYKEPVLASGTDGVGTKLKLAIDLNVHDTIGIDLVAMCVNDLLVCGAEPLFFLDYYATAKLDIDVAASVVSGIGAGCKLAGCSLVGGETAEMPGMYSGSDYDLAGFCVGIVEKSEIIDGKSTQQGDTLIGIASNGPHSNGYSLIRKIIEVSQTDIKSELIGEISLSKALLAPTKIYVKSILSLIKNPNKNTKAVIDPMSWDKPPIFDWLQKKGNVDPHEMYRTFNCGIGMVVCVPALMAQLSIDVLNSSGEDAFIIGEITRAEDGEEKVVLKGL